MSEEENLFFLEINTLKNQKYTSIGDQLLTV